MRSRSYSHLRRIGTGVMLVAMAAFLQQTAMIIVSQALASTGFMPQPAVTLSGPIHFHDSLAGNIHVDAGGDNAAGHVHTAPDSHHHHDADDTTSTSVLSFGCTCVVLPQPVVCVVPFAVASVGLAAHGRLEGVEPDRLNRPPSTPSIA